MVAFSDKPTSEWISNTGCVQDAYQIQIEVGAIFPMIFGAHMNRSHSSST